MTQTFRRRCWAAVAVLTLGCGEVPSSAPVPPRALKISLAENGLQTNVPSLVSLAFTVETTDGQPVGGLTSEAFEIFENSAKVSEFESQKTIQPRGQKSRMYSLLLLDMSGSILRSGEFPNLQTAAVAFVEGVLSAGGGGQRVAVYAFDGRAVLTPVVDFTAESGALESGISALGTRECSRNADCAGRADQRTCAGFRCVDESTNLHGAVVAGMDRLNEAMSADASIPYKQGTLVLFTDGTDQAARVSESAALEAVRRSSSEVFTVGLGGETNEALLRTLGRGGYKPVGRAEELRTAFYAIAQQISARANRFYLLNYCSPKRSGRHELRLVGHHTTPEGEALSGSVQGNFDATGFASGCEIPAPVATP